MMFPTRSVGRLCHPQGEGARHGGPRAPAPTAGARPGPAHGGVAQGAPAHPEARAQADGQAVGQTEGRQATTRRIADKIDIISMLSILKRISTLTCTRKYVRCACTELLQLRAFSSILCRDGLSLFPSLLFAGATQGEGCARGYYRVEAVACVPATQMIRNCGTQQIGTGILV